MRRFTRRSMLTLTLLVIVLGMRPIGTGAQEATPVAGSVGDFLPPVAVQISGGWVAPAEFCDSEAIDAGSLDTIEAPFGGAAVRPASASNQDLYFLSVTLPEGACIGYGSHYVHDGAIVWFVQQGSVSFKTRSIVGMPAAEVTAWDANGFPIPLTTEAMELEAGGWISVDRAVNYSYRNAGEGDAVIMMAVLEQRPAEAALEPEPGDVILAGCKGLCRGRR